MEMTIDQNPTADLIGSLHDGFGYIPKRALRFFLEEREPLLQEARDIFGNLDVHIEIDSQFFLYAFAIFAAKRDARILDSLPHIARLSGEAMEAFFGSRLFDTVSLALAELFFTRPEELKPWIENPELNPAFRAAALQALMYLYGKEALSRASAIAYFLHLLQTRVEKMVYFYEVLVSSALVLYPEELKAEIHKLYQDGWIDAKEIAESEIEEILTLPQQEVLQKGRETLCVSLSDPIAHFKLFLEKPLYDRNDPCPCESGLKYKKCCS